MEISRGKVFSNFLWRFAERSGAQIVAFVVSIILARILAPEAYGTIALVTVFTTILQVFVDSGMANALIQKKDADDLDFSTVFYFNMTVCLVLYSLMFLASPWIAQFYHDPELTPVVRVLSLTLVISGVKNVQQAYVSRTMQFKRFFYATLGGTVGAAILGIAMAYQGYGVWALVAQQLFNATVDTIILWVTVKWRPKWMFSFTRLKSLFSFGWKLLMSGLLDRFYNELRQLIIGKMYSSADLAYYNRGQQLPNVIVNNINTSIDSVLFPAMSKEQDDAEKVRNMTRRSIKTSTYIMAPLMMGLTFMANGVVRLLLTDKWIFCVPYLRIFCITYMFYPLHTANLNAIKAMGRSDLFLGLEIAKKAAGMVLLLVSMWFGVMAMAYSLLAASLISQIINAGPNKKLLNYSYGSQIKDILPNLLLALLMGVCISFLSWLPLPLIVVIAIQVIAGIGLYILGSIITKNDTFYYFWDMLRKFTNEKLK